MVPEVLESMRVDGGWQAIGAAVESHISEHKQEADSTLGMKPQRPLPVTYFSSTS